MTANYNKDKDFLKSQILKTAIELAHEIGWPSVSVRKISKKMDYSTMVIYSVFGNKESLFECLREKGFSKLLNLYKDAEKDKNDPQELIHAITNTTIDFYKKEKELYQVMFGVVGISGVKENCSFNSTASLTAQFIKDAIAKVLDGDVQSLFVNWWAIVHGFISISESMMEGEMAELLPYLDDSIKRFLKK